MQGDNEDEDEDEAEGDDMSSDSESEEGEFICDMWKLLKINFKRKVSNWQYVQIVIWDHTDGLMQERRNSSALAMELRLSSTNPSIHCLSTRIHW